jgi:hypothetical protein
MQNTAVKLNGLVDGKATLDPQPQLSLSETPISKCNKLPKFIDMGL